MQRFAWLIRQHSTLDYLQTHVQGHSTGRVWTDRPGKALSYETEPEAVAVIRAEGLLVNAQAVAWPGITIMTVALARLAELGKGEGDSLSAGDFENVNLAMIGGCHGCGETLAAYNGYPDAATGLWACKGCLRQGFVSVAEFEVAASEGEV